METAKFISIHRASLQDADGILQCLSEAFAPYRDAYTRAAFEDTVLTPETLRRRFEEMQILVAIDDSGRVIGTVAYKTENGEGHIRGMAIRPEQHGYGIAKKLLNRVESNLREAHCTAITLDTTRPLLRAISFYEKNGFRPTGEITSFFGMDLLAYRKEL